MLYSSISKRIHISFLEELDVLSNFTRCIESSINICIFKYIYYESIFHGLSNGTHKYWYFYIFDQVKFLTSQKTRCAFLFSMHGVFWIVGIVTMGCFTMYCRLQPQYYGWYILKCFIVSWCIIDCSICIHGLFHRTFSLTHDMFHCVFWIIFPFLLCFQLYILYPFILLWHFSDVHLRYCFTFYFLFYLFIYCYIL